MVTYVEDDTWEAGDSAEMEKRSGSVRECWKKCEGVIFRMAIVDKVCVSVKSDAFKHERIVEDQDEWKEGVCAHFALNCPRFALWTKPNGRTCFECGIFCGENW